MKPKAALIILDGFGITPEVEGNAVLRAKTPFLDEIFNFHPKCLLGASAENVGLPWGEYGNSEVGHTNIGLGRVVLQDLPQITKTIKENGLAKKKALVGALQKFNQTKGALHLVFVCSDGGVHGHIDQVEPLIKIFSPNPNVENIFLHPIADGRDVPEKSINNYLKKVTPLLSRKVQIASLSGRFFAMDRDKNYERTELAYRSIMGTCETKFTNVQQYIENSYSEGRGDEFIPPASLKGYKANLKGDIFVFTNYRADRAIQLSRSLCDDSLREVNNGETTPNLITMTTYEDHLDCDVLFSNLDLYDKRLNPLSNSLSKILSGQNINQFHVAETEKFAHVTYFFSGGEKEHLDGQRNVLVKSAKVRSYDALPQMKAREVAAEAVSAARQNYGFILANFANPDMVGHSGSLEAATKALEVVDTCLKGLIGALAENNYCVFLTADHGNCDEMVDPKSKKPSKEHSLNPVPFVLVDSESRGRWQTKNEFFHSRPIGVLADIAPTILAKLNCEPTPEFTGLNLIGSLK